MALIEGKIFIFLDTEDCHIQDQFQLILQLLLNEKLMQLQLKDASQNDYLITFVLFVGKKIMLITS